MAEVTPKSYKCAACCNESVTPLLRCSKCKSVCYCNEVCQEKDWRFHRANCKPHNPTNPLKNMDINDQMMLLLPNTLEFPNDGLDAPLKSWKEYSELRNLDIANEDSPRAFLLSYALTLHYSINHLLGKTTIDQGKELHILYLGPSPQTELTKAFLAVLQEFVNLWVGNKKDNKQGVHIHMVGLEVPDVANGRVVTHSETLKVSYHKALFHEIAKEEKVPKIDVAVALNAAIWGFTSWLPTLKHLIVANIPFAISEFNYAGAHKTLQIVQNMVRDCGSLQGEIVSEHNPFRGGYMLSNRIARMNDYIVAAKP